MCETCTWASAQSASVVRVWVLCAFRGPTRGTWPEPTAARACIAAALMRFPCSQLYRALWPPRNVPWQCTRTPVCGIQRVRSSVVRVLRLRPGGARRSRKTVNRRRRKHFNTYGERFRTFRADVDPPTRPGGSGVTTTSHKRLGLLIGEFVRQWFPLVGLGGQHGTGPWTPVGSLSRDALDDPLQIFFYSLII